jgi:hypothetical protein
MKVHVEILNIYICRAKFRKLTLLGSLKLFRNLMYVQCTKSFPVIENERFGLVFAIIGSIILGTVN